MNQQLDKKRIIIFIAIAYGFSWLVALLIYWRGGLANSPEIFPGITEAFLLMGGLYMVGPAVAHLLTRLMTQEGWQNLGLRPYLKRGWRYWLLAWLGTFVLVLAGATLYFVILPQNFDGNLTAVQEMIDTLAANGQTIPFSPVALLAVQVILGGLIAPLIPLNIYGMLGEEFGWRAYLQPKLMPIGGRSAMIWMGLIWSVWHWPLLLMGHAYGLDYPGAPWLGLITFTWLTFVLGVFLGWLTWRAGSVWPAVIGHAVHNGITPASTLLLINTANPLWGPTTAGLIGSFGFSLVALWLLLKADWQPTVSIVQEASPSQIAAQPTP